MDHFYEHQNLVFFVLFLNYGHEGNTMVNDGQMDKTNYNFNSSQIQYNQSSLIQNNNKAIRLF
jgi:hypothetical protein